jgi:hypothetical protein
MPLMPYDLGKLTDSLNSSALLPNFEGPSRPVVEDVGKVVFGGFGD